MTLPGQTFTLPENGLGLSAAVVSKPLILGCSSSGTTNARTEVSQPQAVVDAFGEGPMPEAACRVLQIAGGPVDVIRANGSVAGAAGAVTKVAAGSSTGTITVAGAPYDAYQPMVIITGSGTLGAGTFIYSLDGQDASDVDAHNTWSETLTIPAGGTYAIPRTNLTLTFVPGAGPVYFELGDQHWFECTAPHYNSTDLATAMAAVLASPGDFAWILFTGRDTSAANGATAFATIDTHLTALENQYRYVRGIMDSGDDTVVNVQTAYAAVSDKRITVCYGLMDLPSAKPFAGWGIPGQLVTVALAQRVGRTLLSEDPGRFASGSITGAVNPSHDEFLTGGLDSHKITTVRTYVKAQGLYFTNAWLKSAAGSDYRYWQHGRVMDATCNEVYLQQLKMIAAEPRTNPDGTIFENDARSFEQMVTDGLTAILTAPRNRSGKRGHVSEFSYAIDRSIDLLTTQSIESNVAVRPLGYPKFINTTLGFAKEV